MTNDQARASIQNMCNDVREMLICKNHSYGNAFLDPINIMSKTDSVDMIRTRIDEKLSRMMRGKEYAEEDTILDLAGLFIMLLVARKEKRKK